MDDTQHTIGLTELLSEVDRDLEELRKKNPNDYSFRNTTMWWELERERLSVRHRPATAVRKPRTARFAARTAGVYLAGALTAVATGAAMRLLVP